MGMCRYLFLFFLLCLTGCIGHTLSGNTGSLSETSAAKDGAVEPSYSDIFKGTTRDALIAHYGAPSHTVLMEDGVKILEYKTRQRITHKYEPREDNQCTLRFWLKKNRVFLVDALGEAYVCEYMIRTGTRERSSDLRPYTH